MNAVDNRYVRSYSEAIREYSAARNAAFTPTGKINERDSLSAWQTRAIDIRTAVARIKSKHDAQIRELNERYKPAAAAEYAAPMETDYKGIVKFAKQEATEDLENAIALKRRTLQKHAAAPSEETLRLLQALKMRDSVSAEELTAVAGMVDSNVHALSVLRDIAQSNGYSFPDPSYPTMLKKIDEAEAFGKRMIETLDKPDSDLGYKERLFWMAPGTGEAFYFFNDLDNTSFTASVLPEKAASEGNSSADEKTASAGTETPSNGQRAAIVGFVGGEDLDVVATQFRTTAEAIKRANPELDFNNIRMGQQVIVPGEFIRKTNARGAVSLGQVIRPIDYTPEPATPPLNEGDIVSVQELYDAGAAVAGAKQ